MKRTRHILLGLLLLLIVCLIVSRGFRAMQRAPISPPVLSQVARQTPAAPAVHRRAAQTSLSEESFPPEIEDSAAEAQWAYEITGRVLDARNASPVADAEVSLFRWKYFSGDEDPVGDFIAKTKTNDRGEFFIADPDLKKTTLIVVSKRGWATVGTELFHRFLANRFPLLLYTSPGERIEGIVVDESNQPVGGARIIKPTLSELAGFYQFDYLPARGVSDESGKFVLSGLLPGVYRFFVVKEGFQPYEMADIAAGTKDLLIRLEHGACSIKGKVEMFDGTKAVPHARVTMRYHYRDVGEIFANDGGEFTFERLKPDRYGLMVADAQSQQWLASIGVTVEANKPVTEVVIKCDPRITVSGHVVDDETGKPVAECWIGDFRNIEPSWQKVDSGGRFTRHDVPAERDYTFRLLVKAKGYIGDESSCAEYWTLTKDMRDLKELEDLEIRLKRAAQAQGIVLSPDEKPLPDVILDYMLRPVKGSCYDMALKTNAQGEFSFWYLPSECRGSELRINASHPDYGTMQAIFQAEQWTSDTITLQFAAPSSLIVSVKDESSGQRIRGAKVLLFWVNEWRGGKRLSRMTAEKSP